MLPEILSLAQAYLKELPPAPPAPEPPAGAAIASWIDHTLLKPEVTASQVKVHCREALQNGFAAVYVNPSFLPLATGLLSGSPVLVASVVGFPFGADLPMVKAFEALACLQAGARELDMVMNVGAIKGEAYGLVLTDIQAVVQVAHSQGVLLKVILETGLLNRQEKIIACLIARAAGADFVKTSTGFETGGATVEDIDLMNRVVGPEVKVKASGGVRTYADALEMVRAGASRIGTSAGVQIVAEAAAEAVAEAAAL